MFVFIWCFHAFRYVYFFEVQATADSNPFCNKNVITKSITFASWLLEKKMLFEVHALKKTDSQAETQVDTVFGKALN